MDEAAKKGIEIDVCRARAGAWHTGDTVRRTAGEKGLHELEAAIRRAAAGENETHPTVIRYPAMDEDLTEEQRDDIATAAAALARRGDRADVRQTAGMRPRGMTERTM